MAFRDLMANKDIYQMDELESFYQFFKKYLPSTRKNEILSSIGIFKFSTYTASINLNIMSSLEDTQMWEITI